MKTVFVRIVDDPNGGYLLWLDEDVPNAGTVGPEPILPDLSTGVTPLIAAAARDLVLKDRGATFNFRDVGKQLLGLVRRGTVGAKLDSPCA